MLEVDNVVKGFGGLQVLAGVSLRVDAGEILGLVGPNGAGKSVLQSCIGGSLVPDRGEIRVGGVRTNGWTAERLCRHGVARTFQIPQPFLQMTVYETVLVAARFGAATRAERRDADRSVREAIDFVRFHKPLDTPVTELNTVELKRLDLARALASGPRLLMMDEVAAGLMSGQVGEIVDIVRAIGATGVAVIMVEHIVQSLLGACDRAVVLQGGRIVAEGTPRDVMADPAVIEAYFGTKAAAHA